MSFYILGNDNRMAYVKKNLDDYNTFYNVVVTQPKPNFDELEKCIEDNNIMYVFSSAYDEKLKILCEEKNIRLFNYLKDENVVYKNAILTAKGIVEKTIEDNVSSNDTKALVVGYGNCGKEISEELKKKGFLVTVCVRNNKLENEIRKTQYEYINLCNIKKEINQYKLIYNTVPAMVLDENILCELHDARIYDIASKPGGTDFEFCKGNNIKAGLYLGIPGKCYPKEAGAIIADFVLKTMNNE